MALLNKYRVWCNTQSKYEFTWDEAAPTSCPTNGAHSIDSSKTSIVQKSGDEAPHTTDGKPIFLPSLFRSDIDLYFAGAGDHVTSGRGEGTAFTLSRSTEGTSTATFAFNDWVYAAGGSAYFSGAQTGDHVSMKIFAPATTVSGASPANTGNCNLTDVGGFNLITPAAGDGTHDVADIDKMPVPAPDEDGYWDWSEPDEGKGTVSGSGTPGSAHYNLFDVPVTLVCWVKNLHMIGSGDIDFSIPAVKPKKLLPHWTAQVDLYCSGAHQLDLTWYVVTARKKTT
jgi:hypothetical protein